MNRSLGSMRRRTVWTVCVLIIITTVWLSPSLCAPAPEVPMRDASDEDVDLEDVLNDYYDNLMDVWSRTLRNRTEENDVDEEESEGSKGKRQEKKWSGTDADRNETKSFFDLAVPIQIGNVTYRFLNASYAAIVDMQRATRERDTVDDNPDRIKDMRLSSIRDSVLSLRGGNGTFDRTFPSPEQTRPLKEIFEKQLRESSDWPISDKYTEKSQSFYPSCDVPRNTDHSLWSDQHSMNLFFDVYFPTPQNETTLIIVNAVLRLYTVSQVNYTVPVGSGRSGLGLNVKMDRKSVNIPNFSLLNSDDEKQIRISVYWHTRALRRQRGKKKLLDSQMMPIHGVHNLTFNIRAAVRSWKESGKNFGLAVTVEDEDGTLLKATDYIHPMNCSKWAGRVRPLPLFGLDSPAQYFIDDDRTGSDEGNGTAADDAAQFPGRTVKYPILGFRTREVSLSEMLNLAKLKSVKMEIESGFFNASRSYNRWTSTSGGRSDPRSRVTDFENVPLGSPIAERSHEEGGEDGVGEDAARGTSP